MIAKLIFAIAASSFVGVIIGALLSVRRATAYGLMNGRRFCRSLYY
jgi:hypothetical protein